MPKSHRYDRIVAYALTHPWAITRPMLSMVATVLARHLTPDGRAQETSFIPRETAPPSAPGGGVLVIPIHGVIAPRMDLFSDVSGGATFEGATNTLREAVANRDVGTIVLDFDSPGGSTAGATEFAAEVRRAREAKPVIAHANYQMCSAAYWAGANATEIVASPSAMVGSIGVYAIHEDLSEALASLGVKITFVAAGKYKIDGNETEPLSASARTRLEALVGAMYDAFVADVAGGRGVAEAAVRGGYGEGAVLNAGEALAAGLVDRIEPFDATLSRLVAGPSTSPVPVNAAARSRVAAETNDIEAALYALAL